MLASRVSRSSEPGSPSVWSADILVRSVPEPNTQVDKTLRTPKNVGYTPDRQQETIFLELIEGGRHNPPAVPVGLPCSNTKPPS
jgi:hypothetical protein